MQWEIKRGVAMDNHVIQRAFIIEPTIANPHQIITGLIGEGDARSDTCVHEQMVFGTFDIERQVDQPIKMGVDGRVFAGSFGHRIEQIIGRIIAKPMFKNVIPADPFGVINGRIFHVGIERRHPAQTIVRP